MDNNTKPRHRHCIACNLFFFGMKDLCKACRGTGKSKEQPEVTLGKPCKNCGVPHRGRNKYCNDCRMQGYGPLLIAKRPFCSKCGLIFPNGVTTCALCKVLTTCIPYDHVGAGGAKARSQLYARLYLAQSGRCVICNKYHEKLVIDHDHETGNVRGLLCMRCNTFLGYIDKNRIDMKVVNTYRGRNRRQISEKRILTPKDTQGIDINQEEEIEPMSAENAALLDALQDEAL